MRVGVFSKNIVCYMTVLVMTQCFAVLVYRALLGVITFLSTRCGKTLNTTKREYLSCDVATCSNAVLYEL